MNQMLNNLIITVLAVSAPILLCAIGSLLCDRAGVTNISLEGTMLISAFAAVAGLMAYSFASSFVLGTRSSSQSISRKMSFSIISLIWIYIDFSCVKISFILLLIPYAS